MKKKYFFLRRACKIDPSILGCSLLICLLNKWISSTRQAEPGMWISKQNLTFIGFVWPKGEFFISALKAHKNVNWNWCNWFGSGSCFFTSLLHSTWLLGIFGTDAYFLLKEMDVGGLQWAGLISIVLRGLFSVTEVKLRSKLKHPSVKLCMTQNVLL